MTLTFYRVICEIGVRGSENIQPEQTFTIATDDDLRTAWRRCTGHADPSQWHVKMLPAVMTEFENVAIEKVVASYSDPLVTDGTNVTFTIVRLTECNECGDGFSSNGCHPLVCASHDPPRIR